MFRVLILLLLFIGCKQRDVSIDIANKSVGEWELIYRTDVEGNQSFGSKDELIRLVENGKPVRLGWFSQSHSDSTKYVRHVINAGLLTIVNGEDVFAQVRPFMGQRPNLEKDAIKVELLPIQSFWVLGTDGSLDSMNVNLVKDAPTSSHLQPIGFEVSWYVQASE